MRIQSLRPAFFHSLFILFTEAIPSASPRAFASFLSLHENAFPEILVLDGSKLHKVARPLKVARTVTSAILPGSLEAIYDLRRGILRNLVFDPDGFKGEKHILLKAQETLPKGSLLVYDRYACYAPYWKAMEWERLFHLARASKTLTLHKKYEILSAQKGRAHLRETRVNLGKGEDTMPLRLIEWKTPKGRLRLREPIRHLLHEGGLKPWREKNVVHQRGDSLLRGQNGGRFGSVSAPPESEGTGGVPG